MMIRINHRVASLVALCSLLLTSLALGGCVTETSVYDAAVAEGTPDALHDYLEAYPDGRHAPLARPDLDDLRWLEATTADTAEAYEVYLEDHPDGIHSQDARSVAPARAWREMDFLDDRTAIEEFLVKYEHSAYATKARERMDLLDLYPQHLSIGETVLTPAETGGWLITTEVRNVGTRDIADVGFRVGFENEEGVIVAQLESFMDKQTPYGSNRVKGPSDPLVPGEAHTFQFDLAPNLIPDGWIDDVEHVRLVLSTLTLDDA